MRKKSKSFLRSRVSAFSSNLVWVYPPNNWESTSNKTFVYGYSDPRARLFVQTDEYLMPERINIFPNGNFAKIIKLPTLQNTVKLIQILKGKKKVVTRKIYIKKGLRKKGKNVKKILSSDVKSQLSGRGSQVSIVIDPGHGGKEHGTHSPQGIPESHFNLQIAKLLFKELKKIFKNIYLTRNKDKFISLQERVNFAWKNKCQIFISIHHNALPDGEDPLRHMGVGVYFTHNFSKGLAYSLLNNISKETGLKKYGVFKRDFAVTKPKNYKGVLIECGFLTHPIEASYITKKETQEKIVRGILKGIHSFVMRRK